MRLKHFALVTLLTLIVSDAATFRSYAGTNATVPMGKPDATLDLATTAGVQRVKGQWRYSDTRIIEVDFKSAGADNQPTGAPVKAYDYTPHAGGADFDDSSWQTIEPTTL